MEYIQKIYPLIADQWMMDGGISFGVVPKSLWSRVVKADENNMIKIVTRCMLIRTTDRLILVDVGMGNKRSEKYYDVRFRDRQFSITKALAEVGVEPGDITDVLLTHLHDDHVEAAFYRESDSKYSPLFPGADYYCSKAQWEWANNPNKREGASYFADNLQPMLESGRLNLITGEGEWIPGMDLHIVDGHTAGQIIPFVRYQGRTIVFTADFIPTAYNIPVPYIPAVDTRPLISMSEKESFLEKAVDENYILLFEHDYFNECCTVKKTEKGFIMDESFSFYSVFQ